ncbi:MAG: response regulator [Fibromonadaceae bacterium]|jgi:putative two-component system response regulator|nr:response regulator [Fibromonadaceae bacterium]
MHFIDRTLIRNSVILAVDDSPVLLDALDAILGDLCKKFIMTTTAAEAVDIIIENMPDLVLLDIEMPKMNGFELFEKLKKFTAIARIPVIFITSWEDKRVEAKALEIGAVDYVTKPFDSAVLLHRINIHLNIANYCTNLEQSMKSIENGLISTFSMLMESRDKNTHGHAVRTALYFDVLGEEMLHSQAYRQELTESLLEKMVYAVPLHDIGKVGIPDSILLKPGKFTQKEYEIMQTHTTKGAAVLGRLYQKMPTQHYLHYAEQIAMYHHERYDGSGYPNGLREKDIPLPARIMAVADVYDAMTQNRVYRKAISHKEAYDIMVAGKGTYFDPGVVTIFENVHEEFKKISYMDLDEHVE